LFRTLVAVTLSLPVGRQACPEGKGCSVGSLHWIHFSVYPELAEGSKGCSAGLIWCTKSNHYCI